MRPDVRIRGIYATALTSLLDEHATVVDPSEPIKRRFDGTFPARPAKVHIRDTPDRLGIEVNGPDRALTQVIDRLRTGIDTFIWQADAPSEAVFQARVTDTLGSGAIVDLGATEGFLPYDRSDVSVTEGDVVWVQVADGRPPWTDSRPVLSGHLRVDAGPLTLTHGTASPTIDGVDPRDLLSQAPPENWGLRWSGEVDTMDIEGIEEACARAVQRAEHIDEALAEAEPPGSGDPRRLSAERSGHWVWFGRESRFALDDHRREIVPTMAGHHRIKASDGTARAAVDFAEAVCGAALEAGTDTDSPTPTSSGSGATPEDERQGATTTPPFPFEVVSAHFGPAVGDELELIHGKPAGHVVTLGTGTVTEVDPTGRVTIRREMTGSGQYDGLDVKRHEGDVASTRITEGRWWYPTVYKSEDGAVRGTYVNVCTPVEVFPSHIRYVDLHVDVVRHRDGTVERVDDDELDEAVAAGHLTEELADRARRVAAQVEAAL